jgi:hypothetical protein
MIFEFVEQDLCPIVEHMNTAVVKGREHPWPMLMEGQTLDTLGLSLKFVMQVHLNYTYLINQALSS